MSFKNNYLKLFAAIFLLASAYFVNSSRIFETGSDSQVRKFELTLHQKEEKLEKEILLLLKKSDQYSYENLFRDENNYYKNLFEEDGLLFYIYENDSLKFWTSSFAPLNEIIDSSAFSGPLLRLRNGWFEVKTNQTPNKSSGLKKVVGLCLIKKEYSIENKYLANQFQSGFSLPDNSEIAPVEYLKHGQDSSSASGIDHKLQDSLKQFSGNINHKGLIKTLSRQPLCIINFNYVNSCSSFIRFLLTILNLSGFLFLIIFIKVESRKFSGNIGNNKSVLLFIFSIVLLRLIALVLQFPQAFYQMPLFSPENYATSFLFPSLGDFIINALMLFYISYYLRMHISLGFLKEMQRVKKRKLFYFLIFFLLSFSLLCEYLIKGLIEDSNISFNVNNLLELSAYSYGALASMGLLFFAFFFIYDLVAFGFYSENVLPRHIIPAFVICCIPIVALLVWMDNGTLPVIWSAVIFTVLYFIYYRKKGEYDFASIVIIISVFSILAAHSLIKHISGKEINHRKVLAEKLSIEEDPIAEVLYSEIEPRLQSDIIFSNLKYGLVNYDKDYFDNALREKYFSGYLSRYDVKSYLFRTDGNPVSPFNKISYDRNYFEQMIIQSGKPCVNDNMMHIENPGENEDYIIRIFIKNRSGNENSGVMYITMESKLQPEANGFPELLLDKKMKTPGNIADKKYSFAKYRKGKLTNHFGKFNYSLYPANYGNDEKKISFSDEGNYNHLVYRSDNNNAVILSKPNEGWVEFMTTFSYLFTLFGILVLLFLNLRSRIIARIRMHNMDFNYKIQVMVVAVMVISMILFGLGTSYYIYLEYDKKNHRILSEKIHSVLTEVEQKLGTEDNLGEKLKEYITYILTKFSTVFFSDINLYNKDGTLLASSRAKLFSEGIISRQMDPKAFYQLKFLQKSEFIQDEKIGDLDYHSAYIPFKNKNGEVLAYLNLPYFARQDTLEDEISSFLFALINIYVLLFAFSLIAALFISNAITRPLQYVQAMLSRVEIGKTNTPIEYHGKDEIGRLVKVYNSKVVELEKNAELLAKSEKESAWREMAKQVAHEIKNPLTPMKLSVQHLQRALKENPENNKELLGRFSTTMVEQIDALAAIANEFSNFAKMPKAINEPLNLVFVIENSINLFRETPGVKIIFNNENPNAMVLADREQLTRVFINLIQNSIQAIPKEKNGEIIITLNRNQNNSHFEGRNKACLVSTATETESGTNSQKEKIIISIKDNGIGISPGQKEKIFLPNFTTKSTGMGLGLAMVKSIVEEAKGTIWFETELGTGTVFYVELPEWVGKA